MYTQISRTHTQDYYPIRVRRRIQCFTHSLDTEHCTKCVKVTTLQQLLHFEAAPVLNVGTLQALYVSTSNLKY
jgi:hypothetical protein